jgi:hypothetical protein
MGGKKGGESESESAEVTILAPSCPPNFTDCLLTLPTVTFALTKPMTAPNDIPRWAIKSFSLFMLQKYKKCTSSSFPVAVTDGF